MTSQEIKLMAQEVAKELSKAEVELTVTEEEVNGGKYNTLLLLTIVTLVITLIVNVFSIAVLSQIKDIIG